MSAGESFGGPRTSSSSATPFPHALPTQTNDAPATIFPSKMSSLAVSGVLGNESAVDHALESVYKNNAKEAEEMKHWIEEIRAMFTIAHGGWDEISLSPYDTAWVGLVPALDGSQGPQFPKSLQWIINNQLPDGSWGDKDFFSYYDRLLNSVACVVALKTWELAAPSVERGVKFIQQNLQKMETEEEAHMMIGFEICFPALIEYAKEVGLDLPYDAPIIVSITAEREKKLHKIPMDLVHEVPTTLLHSLEGFHEDADWEKLLKLQSSNGSFLFSPAATAACLLHVNDDKALNYINGLLDRFDDAVPNVYPVDLFQNLWMIDRLQRLGIDRFFEKEIKRSLDYVYKYYENCGIAWARNSPVQDLDDTSMGFRLLRQHGYDVSEDVFRQFRAENGSFFCFAGQTGQAVTGLFNFYRATQIRFPGESLLQEAEHFARDFLADKLAKNECFDKWIITKDLAGEVAYALDTPWYRSLPRVEARSYIDQYGVDDIWIGKSLYRMPFVNNNSFLALAKTDFNLCQSIHQQELHKILGWNAECRFGELPFARQKVYEGFFTAASLFGAPELSPARYVWARNCVLTTVVDDFFDVGSTLAEMQKFVAATKEWDPSLMDGTTEEAKKTFNGLYNSLNAMTQEGIIAQGRDIGVHLRKIWLRWVDSCLTEARWTAEDYWPSFDEYLEVALPSIALEPIVLCTMFYLGEQITDEFVSDPKKLRLMELVNRVGRLVNDIQGYEREDREGTRNAVSILMRENPGLTVEEVIGKIRNTAHEAMEELVREVHQPSPIPKSIRQMHFNMARVMLLFYKSTDGFSSRTAMKDYVRQILFDPVS
uniref:Ent-kaurene synthase n=1 Tax=Pallavicinia lyellii TaxID=56939 RepID=A0A8U0DC41_PALLY|nr:ent-kaurene synthase [Pallavicinia lyellii]